MGCCQAVNNEKEMSLNNSLSTKQNISTKHNEFLDLSLTSPNEILKDSEKSEINPDNCKYSNEVDRVFQVSNQLLSLRLRNKFVSNY